MAVDAGLLVTVRRHLAGGCILLRRGSHGRGNLTVAIIRWERSGQRSTSCPARIGKRHLQLGGRRRGQPRDGSQRVEESLASGIQLLDLTSQCSASLGELGQQPLSQCVRLGPGSIDDGGGFGLCFFDLGSGGETQLGDLGIRRLSLRSRLSRGLLTCGSDERLGVHSSLLEELGGSGSRPMGVLLGPGAEIGRGQARGLEDPCGLLTEHRGELALVEDRTRLRGVGRHRALFLEAPEAFSRVGELALQVGDVELMLQFTLASELQLAGDVGQVGADLDGIEPLPHGRELAASDQFRLDRNGGQMRVVSHEIGSYRITPRPAGGTTLTRSDPAWGRNERPPQPAKFGENEPLR